MIVLLSLLCLEVDRHSFRRRQLFIVRLSIRTWSFNGSSAVTKRARSALHPDPYALLDELSSVAKSTTVGIRRPNGVAVRAAHVNLPAATDDERISESSGSLTIG